MHSQSLAKLKERLRCERQRARTKTREKNKQGPNQSISTECTILFIFEILTNGQDILTSSSKVPRQDITISMGKQVRKFVDLLHEFRSLTLGRGSFGHCSSSGASKQRSFPRHRDSSTLPLCSTPGQVGHWRFLRLRRRCDV